MNERYIQLAVPFFFLAILLEVIVTRRREGGPYYRFADSITNLACGVGQQALGPFLKLATLAGYVVLYERRLFTVSEHSVVGWVVLLFGVDLAYYWFHRASHRINVVWAGHVVHHQSEEYNLTVALRQSWMVKVAESVFYWPLAIAGFPPAMFLAMTTLNTIYQFWIHTRIVGKLGPLEWFMNTPSHHRVHHGIDPKYIDKNYAGVFIVWDRLFGTFHEEEEEPVYGIVKPLASWNPLWANVHYFVEMGALMKRCDRLGDKLKVIFAPPDWRPAALGGNVTIPEASRATQHKYDAHGSRGLIAYVAVNFAIVSGGLTLFLEKQALLPVKLIILAAVLTIAALVAWGGLFEKKRWAAALEVARIGATVLAVAFVF